MNGLLMQSVLSMPASFKLKSNGDSAKSAGVKIVAYTGDVIDYPPYGAMIFDLDSVTFKSRIPLDWEHDGSDNIGYLNKFVIDNHELHVSGAITPWGNDKGAELVHKMSEGVPYQASIETHDFVVEIVGMGEIVHVNGQTVEGPVVVVRDWSLDAVAICKWGKDSNTETRLAASKKNSGQRGKVLFARVTKDIKMEETKTIESAEAVVEATVTEPVVETEQVEEQVEAVVETEAEKAEVVDEVEVEAEAKVEEPVAVEAETPVEEEVTEPEVVMASESVEAVDPRSEFKAFVTEFGAELAATYFADGLSLSAAKDRFLAHLKAELADAKSKLSASDRGAPSAIRFADETSTKATMKDMVRMAGR